MTHRSFQKRLKEYGMSAAALITQMYSWFDGFTAQREKHEAVCPQKGIEYKTYKKIVNESWIMLSWNLTLFKLLLLNC